MRIEIEKASGKSICRSRNCKRIEEYTSKDGRIKKDTKCLSISIGGANGGATAFYCWPCIDDIYINMKSVLDPKLRILL